MWLQLAMIVLGLILCLWACGFSRIRRPLFARDAVLAAIVIFLPMAPFLNTAIPLGTGVRYCLALALCVLIMFGRVPLRRPTDRAMHVGIVGFVAIHLLGAVMAQDASFAVIRGLNWFMFFPLVLLSYSGRGPLVVLRSAMAAAGLLVVGILFQALGWIGGIWGGIPIHEGGQHVMPILVKRYSSFVLNPNDMGLLMACALVVAIGLYGGSRLRKNLASLVCVAFAGSLLLTSSRGALLALPVALVFMFLYGSVKLRRRIMIAGAVFVILLTAVAERQASVGTTIGSLSRVVVAEDRSAKSRVDLWLNRVRSGTNPVIGGGYGAYGSIQRLRRDMSVSDERVTGYRSLTVDNGWLKIYLEHGMLGLAAFGAILFAAFRAAAHRHREAHQVIACAVLAMILVRGFSADVFDISPWNALLWLSVGLTCFPVGSGRHPSDQSRRYRQTFHAEGTAAMPAVSMSSGTIGTSSR